MDKLFISFKCTMRATDYGKSEFDPPKRFCIPVSTITEIEEILGKKTTEITARFSDRIYTVYYTSESYDEIMNNKLGS